MSRLSKLEKIARGRKVTKTIAKARPTGIELFKDKEYLKEILEKQSAFVTTETDRRDTQKLHWSFLVGERCMRAWQLCKQYNLSVPSIERPSSSTHIMWEVGRGVERYVRKLLIQYHGMDKVFGDWRCKCGAFSHIGVMDSEHECSVCKTRANKYHELHLVYRDAVVGHPDIVLVVGGKFLVVEIKSIARSYFDDLPVYATSTQALPELETHANYRQQLLGYVAIMKGMFGENAVHDFGSLLFVNKDFVKTDVYREYHIPASGTTQSIVNDLLNYGVEVYEDNVDLAPRLSSCESKGQSSWEARSCTACSVCFRM